MADLADVEAALVGLIAAALYPNGADTASAIGMAARIYRGWPVLGGLDADLAAGIINISVLAVPGQVRNTTRWNDPSLDTYASPTITLSVRGSTATVGGAAGAGQLAGLLIDGLGYAYRATSGDTPGSVAAALARLIGPTASADGATVTVTGARRLTGRVAADAADARELRRQQQSFRVTLWCGDPASRDVASAAVDLALGQLDFITLPDGSSARVRFESTASSDRQEEADLYRRDLVYSVEYATVLLSQLPTMLFGDLAYDGTTIFV